MSDFTGVTFSYQSAAAADDAIVRRAILPDGILTGCAVSYSGTTLTLARGHLIVCGRQIRIPQPINYAVTDATSGFARLLLSIDLTKTSSKDTFEQVYASIQYATSEDGFDALIQSDINDAGTLYQLPVCVVSLGTGGITGIVSQLEQSKAEGGGLNFKIVGGETRPNNPDDNTIWVCTAVKISGWVIDAAEPAAPVDGTVWIAAAESGDTEFNAAKNNMLTIYPAGCQQYISGVWEIKTAYIYKDGAWVQFSTPWNGELFEQGDVHADITGGWQYDVNGTSTPITNDNTGFTFACMNGSDSSTGWFYTLGLVDITEWNTLVFDFTRTLQEGDQNMKCIISKYKQSESSATAVGYGQTGPVSVDISSLSGSYYLSMTKWGGKSTINRIYMTK